MQISLKSSFIILPSPKKIPLMCFCSQFLLPPKALVLPFLEISYKWNHAVCPLVFGIMFFRLSTLLHISVVHSFFHYCIVFHIYHLLKDIWIVSTFKFLLIIILWTFHTNLPFTNKNVFLFLSCRIAGLYYVYVLTF